MTKQAKTNHVAAVLRATQAALGTSAPKADAKQAPAKPSGRLGDWANRKPAAAPKAAPAKGKTDLSHLNTLAKGDW